MKIFEQFELGQIDNVGRTLVDKMWNQRPDWAVASISDYDASFFAGLLISVKPHKIVEVGVASGWGSAILLQAMKQLEVENYQYFGVDIAERFFYDENFATGQAVQEVVPDLQHRYNLMTGCSIAEVASEIGGDVDFAFIDAHHMHPWPTLDLLALLPFIKPGSWVALHDLSLCRKEDQEHHNRGPKYLFEGWEGDKAHSIQIPTMAGAIRIGDNSISHLPLLLDILYTPWELPVEQRFVNSLHNLISAHYGSEWGKKLKRAAEIGNYLSHKMHSKESDVLSFETGKSNAAASAIIDGFKRRFFKLLGQ